MDDVPLSSADMLSVPDAKRFLRSFPYAFLFLEGSTADQPDFDASQLLHEGNENYIELRLNPQGISVREPFATAVQVTQGGGKYIESRGMVLKQISITGTTGFTPRPNKIKPQVGKTILNTSLPAKPGLEWRSLTLSVDYLASISGFKEFYKLRQIFRKYGNARRHGLVAEMHYIDYKGDEYWHIEPIEFSLERSSRRPFLYNYHISFQCIEPSIIYDVTGKRFFDPVPVPTVTQKLEADRRLLELVQNGVNYAKNLSGDIKNKFQGVLTTAGTYLQLVDDAASSVSALADLPSSLILQTLDAVSSAFDVYHRVLAAGGDVGAEWEEVNEFMLEVRTAALAAYPFYGTVTNSKPVDRYQRENEKYTRNRGALGNAVSLMPESGETPVDNIFGPVLSAQTAGSGKGLEQLGGRSLAHGATAIRTIRILDGETIFDLARRTLGDAHLFYQIALLNNLQSPYIVPRSANRPPGTLSYGDLIAVPTFASGIDSIPMQDVEPRSFIYAGTVSDVGTSVELVDDTQDWVADELVGMTVTMNSGSASGATRVITGNTTTIATVNRAWSPVPAAGDQYQIEQKHFSLRKEPDLESLAFGKDVLVSFARDYPFKATVMLSPTGDLAVVRGKENAYQAIRLLMNTEQGTHFFHRRYGLALPVGSAMRADRIALYSFLVRQSLGACRFVADVRQPRITAGSGTMSLDVEIRLVNSSDTARLEVSR